MALHHSLGDGGGGDHQALLHYFSHLMKGMLQLAEVLDVQ
eukprot:CAMPEP_0114411862 /NCGR_PEP_ID=MMETSP0103-20121206/21_1 /TAXON_ID=37642 ORGANISM="Paraphysomonas imperforata, Strain PA2" /NCGR_SAMPLE_ID=MMETSP0103 /ASSEMBLY_ACC=CAM_ASM_000201 /LENGTH=39 /DNA_ID= /DNA_START= /DNA_END= /DNA_ORIENTATION=